MKLSQSEADSFMQMEKIRKFGTAHSFPDFKEKISIDLISSDLRHEFLLDINRGSISLKCTYQNRVQVDVILVRVDINGAPHQNPDGNDIVGSHIHIYREGYGDKWAYPLPMNFTDATKLDVILNEFMDYCNITQKPMINNIWNV